MPIIQLFSSKKKSLFLSLILNRRSSDSFSKTIPMVIRSIYESSVKRCFVSKIEILHITTITKILFINVFYQQYWKNKTSWNLYVKQNYSVPKITILGFLPKIISRNPMK